VPRKRRLPVEADRSSAERTRLLLAPSRHRHDNSRCPLSEVKRTLGLP
jgi:hypothetical protein